MRAALSEAARLAAALGPLALARGAGGAGPHARRRAGEGTEFWQFRPVMPGEPAGRIDWRRSARGDQLWARERERADAARLWLWLDLAASLDFASEAGLPTKRARGAVLLLALGMAAMAAGERVGVGVELAASPDALGAALGRAPFSAAGFRPGDVLVAASDFLGSDPAAIATMQSGVLLHLIDPAERDFALAGDCLVEAAPGGPALRLAPAEAAGADYAAAMDAHAARIAAAGRRPGWAAHTHVTRDPPARTLAAIAALLARGVTNAALTS